MDEEDAGGVTGGVYDPDRPDCAYNGTLPIGTVDSWYPWEDGTSSAIWPPGSVPGTTWKAPVKHVSPLGGDVSVCGAEGNAAPPGSDPADVADGIWTCIGCIIGCWRES